MSTARTHAVVDLAERVEPGPMRRVMDVLQTVIGKTTAFSSVELLKDLAGYAITNAAATPGTDVPEARTVVHFGDAGVDQVRVVVRGNNSAAGSVVVEVYRITGSATIASVTVTDATLGTFQGDWTVMKPTGEDEEIGLRVVGDGAFDPVLHRVDFQMRTLRAAT